MSLTEYVDRINAIFERGLEQYDPSRRARKGWC